MDLCSTIIYSNKTDPRDLLLREEYLLPRVNGTEFGNDFFSYGKLGLISLISSLPLWYTSVVKLSM